MGSDITRRRVRRTLTAAGTSALLAIGFTAGFDAPATGAAGAAAAPPGPYSASAHGDIVDLDVDLLGGDLLGVQGGPLRGRLRHGAHAQGREHEQQPRARSRRPRPADRLAGRDGAAVVRPAGGDLHPAGPVAARQRAGDPRQHRGPVRQPRRVPAGRWSAPAVCSRRRAHCIPGWAPRPPTRLPNGSAPGRRRADSASRCSATTATANARVSTDVGELLGGQAVVVSRFPHRRVRSRASGPPRRPPSSGWPGSSTSGRAARRRHRRPRRRSPRPRRSPTSTCASPPRPRRRRSRLRRHRRRPDDDGSTSTTISPTARGQARPGPTRSARTPTPRSARGRPRSTTPARRCRRLRHRSDRRRTDGPALDGEPATTPADRSTTATPAPTATPTTTV